MPTRLSPKKLLLTKWTAVNPTHKEKHFLVTKVIVPELPALPAPPTLPKPQTLRVDTIELQAVHSGRSALMPWRELTDESRWRQGWV